MAPPSPSSVEPRCSAPISVMRALNPAAALPPLADCSSARSTIVHRSRGARPRQERARTHRERKRETGSTRNFGCIFACCGDPVVGVGDVHQRTLETGQVVSGLHPSSAQRASEGERKERKRSAVRRTAMQRHRHTEGRRHRDKRGGDTERRRHRHREAETQAQRGGDTDTERRRHRHREAEAQRRRQRAPRSCALCLKQTF
eukprot:COSAG03_NODE_3456_length_1999_cov_3.493158_3_plen_202_part_00